MNEDRRLMGLGNNRIETPWDECLDGAARHYLFNGISITGILKRIDLSDGKRALFFSPCLIFDSLGLADVSLDEARRPMETEPFYNPVPVYDPDPVKNLQIIAERHNEVLRKKLELPTEEGIIKSMQWHRERGFKMPAVY